MIIGAPLTGEAMPVLQKIEVASSFQIPGFHIIGLPGPEVAEARERVRAAIEASGFQFPKRRVVLNLSPASIRKRGTGLDLAMALAVLASADEEPIRVEPIVAWGELGLDGTIKPAGQVMRTLYATWKAGLPRLFISSSDHPIALRYLEILRESREVSGSPPQLVPVTNLAQAWRCVFSRDEMTETCGDVVEFPRPMAPSYSQLLALPPSIERILGVASAGAHHLLLLGPHGTGKSHAMDWLMALQPPATADVRVHHLLIQELGGAFDAFPRETGPVRRVSGQVRPAALLGGISSSCVRPGEFSLAHGGLLIADEFPEWAQDSREAFREPLERGQVILSRSQGALELPARFTFAANGNLCPCGGWPSGLPLPPTATENLIKPSICRCPPSARRKYLDRLSGPILDRLDLAMIISALPPQNAAADLKTRLFALREQVMKAGEIAKSAWGAPPGLLPPAHLHQLLQDRPKWQLHLSRHALPSLRARHKLLKTALSLAAWDAAATDERLAEPSASHFREAAFYRPEAVVGGVAGISSAPPRPAACN